MESFQITNIAVILFLTSLWLSAPSFGAEPPPSRQILYELHTNNVKTALDSYKKWRLHSGKHDIELLQQIGLTILDKGWKTKEPEIQLMTLFGAGVSMHERCLYILAEGLHHQSPQLQLIALNFIGKFNNDNAEGVLNKALSSNELIIRMEALQLLVQKKHPKVVAHLDALMAKVNEKLIPLFPQFYAQVGDTHSMKVLKRFLVHPDEKVRVAAVLSAARHNRDDLLPQIRKLASHHDLVQQEACAFALGKMHDEVSLPRLESLANSSSVTTRLAAWQALHQLGKSDVKRLIEEVALDKNPFAIAVLGDIEGSEDVLLRLMQSSNLQVRVNAALALLDRQDPRCFSGLADVFIQDSRDLVFAKISTPSGALAAWKAIPSARQNFKDNSVVTELSLGLRENALKKTLDLPTEDFIKIAAVLFEADQNDLIPVLIELLENSRTPQAIELLKKYRQKVGAPLIRNYCNLALFNLKEEGSYKENLEKWVNGQHNQELLRLRPYIPLEARDSGASYSLDPQETSKLLITAFEAFARMQSDEGIDVLIEAIANGHPQNRYPLAGLLIRSTY